MTDTTNQHNGDLSKPNDLCLLENINRHLKRLGSDKSYSALPQLMPESKVLLGMRIVQIDDFRSALAAFVPQLMVATGGLCSFVLHTRALCAQRLAEEIDSLAPDLVLLDYQLAGGVQGDSVARALLALRPESRIFGFSSDTGFNLQLEAAGALGSVRKRPSSAAACLAQVAQLTTQLGITLCGQHDPGTD